MGAQLRAIRRQIRSVQSTKKITRAMELIAASQIRRAQERVQQARPYAEQITRAIGDVTGQADNLEHPLLEERKDPKGAAVFVVTSDRGLAGAYSANVLKEAEGVLAAVRALDAAAVSVETLAVREPTLDDVFLELTGHRTDDPVSAARPQPDRPLAEEGAA